MTPDRWTRLSDWHNAWLAADAAGRERLRIELAVSDPDLLTEADELAAVSTDLPGFLETPAFVLAAPALSADDPPLEANTMVGPYRVTGLIARGGMGDVYRATDLRLRRDVAVKVLSPDTTVDTRPVERFVHEARLTASLDHPNIVRLYDIGLVDGRPYFVAELLDGETLRARIGRGALAVPDVLRIGADVGRGLGAAHAAGFVHRDLKPENIFLTRSGTTKILDFGIATLADGEAQREGRSALSGHLLGTAGYLAPEQIRGHEIDGRADLFTLGAILFEMLTGRRAFARDHTVDTLHAILHETPATVLELRHDVPPALAALVRRLLETAPDERPDSAADVVATLDDIAGLAAQPDRPSRYGTTPRHPPQIARGAIALAALAIVLATAVGWVYRRGAPSVPPGTASTPGDTGTRNSEALENYLRGRAHAAQATGAEFSRAVDSFRQAVTIDPDYADAWAALGAAYVRLPLVGGVRPAGPFSDARQAAARALELAPDHAGAQWVLGTVAFWFEWDYPRAEALLRRAATRQPEAAEPQVYLAHLLSNLGRHDEALLEIGRARARGPALPIARSLQGQFLFMARRYDEALSHLDSMVSFGPTFVQGHVMRAYPLISLGRYDEAIGACDRALELEASMPRSASVAAKVFPRALRGYALARAGRRAEAEAILDSIRILDRETYVPPTHVALVLHGLGRDEAALEQLGRAVEAHDPAVTFLGVDPKWDDLRGSPPFQALVARVNLLDVSNRATGGR